MKKISFVLALSLIGSIFADADTYALCIGINQYPEHKKDDGSVETHNLKGCVNDANSMKEMLSTKFSVPEANIHTLFDSAAGETGFVEQIKWLISSAKAGDQIVFSYSGHGASIADKDAVNGKRSYIVLGDEKLVPGKLFGDVAKILANRGIGSTFVFDSCFSGGMSRPIDSRGMEVRTKFWGIMTPKVGQVVTRKNLEYAAKLDLKTTNKDGDAKGNYAFLFASKDDQPSSDVSMSDRPSHGLFTLLFSAVMEDNPNTPVKSLVDLINAVREDLNTKIKASRPDFGGFGQIPNFETSSPDRADKPAFIK